MICIVLGFPREIVAFYHQGERLCVVEKKENTSSFPRENLPQLFVRAIQHLREKSLLQFNTPLAHGQENTKNQEMENFSHKKKESSLIFVTPCWPGPLTAMRNALCFSQGLLHGSPGILQRPSFFDLYNHSDHVAVFLGGSKWMMPIGSKSLYKDHYGPEAIIEPTDLDKALFSYNGTSSDHGQKNSLESMFFGRKKPEAPWIALDHAMEDTELNDLLHKCWTFGENIKYQPQIQ